MNTFIKLSFIILTTNSCLIEKIKYDKLENEYTKSIENHNNLKRKINFYKLRIEELNNKLYLSNKELENKKLDFNTCEKTAVKNYKNYIESIEKLNNAMKNYRIRISKLIDDNKLKDSIINELNKKNK